MKLCALFDANGLQKSPQILDSWTMDSEQWIGCTDQVYNYVLI